MIHPYDKTYLEQFRISFGLMLDYAVKAADYSLETYWEIFLDSKACKKIEQGDISLIAGKSGAELLYETLEINKRIYLPESTRGRSKNYWTGWALAYFHWETGRRFNEITEFVSINEIRNLYTPYHEMDIRQFCDKLDELIASRAVETNLKRKRTALGISQSELATKTGIPVRTIQQYEQRQKDINNARAQYIFKLSKALYCDPYELIEKVRVG